MADGAVADGGVVTVVGVFEPGSCVRLVRVESERVFRAERGEEVERRLVDENGNIGWEGLTIGAYYIAVGYVNGYPVEIRCVATDVSQPSNDLNQPPVQSVQPTIGTQEAPQTTVPPIPPAPVEGEPPLQEGIPPGVAASQLGIVYYIDHGSGDLPEGMSDSGLQAPAYVPAEGDTVPAQPLLSFSGADTPDPGRFEAYAGPTEPKGTAPADSSLSGAAPEDVPAVTEPPTDAGPQATGDGGATESVPPVAESQSGGTDAAPAPDQPTATTTVEAPGEPPATTGPVTLEPTTEPVQAPAPDVAPVADAVPSESAGTGDQAGAPSEPSVPEAATAAEPPAPDAPAPADAPAATDAAAPAEAPADAPAAPAADEAPAADGSAAAPPEQPADPATQTAPPAQEGA